MSSLPIENLELRALEQRNHLHERAAELKTRIRATRESLDILEIARRHFVGAGLAVSAVGLLAGYAVGGLFAKR
jgi:hypothetical protein